MAKSGCITTFRFYDAEAGRFITQDPVGLAGGLNLYQYGPNPQNWVDPLEWTCSAALTVSKPKALSSPGLSSAGKTFLEKQFIKKKNALNRAAKESPNKPSVMRESPQHLIRAAHEPDELFRL
nr:RHS repeat-associated core domain-containing protein [Pseudomonas juntendi]